MNSIEKQPQEIWNEILTHSYNRHDIESAECLVDIYRSLEVCNKLARCNRQWYTLVHNLFDQKYDNSSELTVKEFCQRKLGLIQDERSDVLSYWLSWRISWKYYNPPYDKNSWGHKYGIISYCRIPQEQREYIESHVHDINQPLMNIELEYAHNGGYGNSSFLFVLPLHITCLSKELPDIRFLIRCGADVNKQNRFGKHALNCMVSYEKMGFAPGFKKAYKVAELLLQNGLNINQQDNLGKTALMNVMRKYDVPLRSFMRDGGYTQGGGRSTGFPFKLVKLLIDATTDFNIPDNQGNTLLFYLLKKYPNYRKKYSLLEILKKIIDKGANVNVMNEMKQTPLDIAREKQDAEIISFIESRTTQKLIRLMYAQNNPYREYSYLIQQYVVPKFKSAIKTIQHLNFKFV